VLHGEGANIMLNDIKHILAVVNQKDDGEIVLQKAEQIAKATGASIRGLKVIYEDLRISPGDDFEQNEALKSRLITTEETMLEQLLKPVLEATSLDVDSAVVWRKDEFRGIIDAAEEFAADLIVKSTNHPVPEIIRTPQDWHLLRHSDVPVMLVKPVTWKSQPLVVAAVDIEDPEQEQLSKHIMDAANQMCKTLDGKLYLVNSFPGISQFTVQMRQTIGDEITNKVSRLAHDMGIEPDQIFAAEGKPHEALERLVDHQGAEILILGTSQRQGPSGFVFGNTSEAILHHVNSDVLVLK
tara:strand:+ start:86 stop:976 length:891 start_codon:yes stop_codon:yes gene_type:complete